MGTLSIQHNFPLLNIEGQEVTFDHLTPFNTHLTGAGNGGANIAIRTSFRSHVFSKTPENEEPHHFVDEKDQPRLFCPDRHAVALTLPSICRRMIEENFLTWEMQDRNRINNMAVIDGPPNDGTHSVIFYYLFPSQHNSIDVELVVLTCYTTSIDFSHFRRRYKVQQMIKKCYFEGQRIPKNKGSRRSL